MYRQAHVLLSKYLADRIHNEEVDQHRPSFYLGAIMPDTLPRMRMKQHEYDVAWEDTKDRIREIEAMPVTDAKEERAYCRRLGIILHYLADFFTCPHNPSYGLSMMEHAIYESWEALQMRLFLYTPEADQQFSSREKTAEKIHSTEELFAYIEWMHERYMEKSGHTPYGDCRWILNVCAITAIVLMKEVKIRRS